MNRPRFVSVPFTPEKLDASKRLVRAAQKLEYAILNLLLPEGQLDPPSPNREQSLALTKLEECVMWANRAIAVSDLGKEPIAVISHSHLEGAPCLACDSSIDGNDCKVHKPTDVPCDHYFPSSGAGTQCTRCRSFHPCDPRNLLAVAEKLGAGEYTNYNDTVAYKLIVTPRS